MSTRAYLGKFNKDQSVTYVYTHSDGYPSHHAPILLEHYNTPEKLDKLLALGGISVLDVNIDPFPSAPHSHAGWNDNVPKVISHHTFDSPQAGVVIAYHRDRGEDLDIGSAASEADFWKLDENCYLYKDGVWLYAEMTYDRTRAVFNLQDVLDWERNIAFSGDANAGNTPDPVKIVPI